MEMEKEFDQVVLNLVRTVGDLTRLLHEEASSPMYSVERVEVLSQALHTACDTLSLVLYYQAFDQARRLYGPGVFWGLSAVLPRHFSSPHGGV